MFAFKNKSILVAIFVLVFVITFLTPMHSDDYAYYNLGFSLEGHLAHYINWSGRILADFISAGILLLKIKFIKAFLCALALPILVYIIATLPYYDEKKSIYIIKLWPIFILIFIAYWLGNPALGQVTFWVVGQANYLWPLVFAALYFKYLLKVVTITNLSVNQSLVFLLLALIVGLSNEMVSILALYISFVSLCYVFYIKRPNKLLLLIAFIFMVVGTLILFLAPGNMVRLAHPTFAYWRTMTLGEKIHLYFSQTFINTIENYLLVYFILGWAFFRNWKKLISFDRYLVLLSLSAFFAYLGMLMFSPSTGGRVLLTGLFFLLMAITFSLKKIEFSSGYSLDKVGFMLLIITFLCSYILIVQAYYSFSMQDKIRIEIIQHQLKERKQIANIPEYYIPTLLREGDYPDLAYHSEAMARFYGLDKIETFPVDFDYSKVLNKSCSPIFNNELFILAKVKCITLLKNPFVRTSEFVVEFLPEVKYYLGKDYRFYLEIQKVKKGNNVPYRIDIPLVLIELNNRYFYNISVGTSSVGVGKKAKITVGLYQSSHGKPLQPIEVNF